MSPFFNPPPQLFSTLEEEGLHVKHKIDFKGTAHCGLRLRAPRAPGSFGLPPVPHEEVGVVRLHLPEDGRCLSPL